MPQSARLRVTRPLGRVREREKLNLRSVRQPQVQLMRVAFGSEHFRDNLQPQNLRVETLRPGVVGTNDGDMMRPQNLHEFPPTPAIPSWFDWRYCDRALPCLPFQNGQKGQSSPIGKSSPSSCGQPMLRSVATTDRTWCLWRNS